MVETAPHPGEAITDRPPRGTRAGEDVLVRFEGVQKTYDGVTLVIQGLDLEVRKGEFLTLLGPSGSGKTTTLMMLAGFETPTAGLITLDGQPLNHVPPHRRRIGMVFQDYALFPHMTVAENVGYSLRVRRVPRSERRMRVQKALSMVQLDDFAGRKPSQLSGGQQQRVALARALVFEPRLVLLDEPLGALDRQLREQMQIELKHLHERLGVTMVYVTHDQEEALTMSDRVAVFHDGRIQQLASPTALYETPQNSFVARFIGDNNTLAGRVETISGDECRVVLDGGQTVIAKPVRVDGLGSRTSLSVRPERVTVSDRPSDLANSYPAEVLELIYLGAQTLLRVRALDTDSFMVKVPASAEDSILTVGRQVHVSWRARHCRALDPV